MIKLDEQDMLVQVELYPTADGDVAESGTVVYTLMDGTLKDMSDSLDLNEDEDNELAGLCVRREHTIDLVQDLTITGGPETPFESVSLKISRKQMKKLYPDWVEAGSGVGTSGVSIRLGLSRIMVTRATDGDTPDTAAYVVTSAKISSSEYTLTAYVGADTLRGQVASEGSSTYSSTTFDQIVTSILVYDAKFPFSLDHIISKYSPATEYTVSVVKNANLWSLLQLCTMVSGAKTYFSGARCYICDYSSQSIPSEGCDFYRDYPTLTSTVDYDFDGLDNYYNTVVVRYGYIDSDGKSQTDDVTVANEESVKIYGTKSSQVSIDSLIVGDEETMKKVAEKLGQEILKYTSWPMQSISFTLAEKNTASGSLEWVRLIPPEYRTPLRFSDEAEEMEILLHSGNGDEDSAVGTISKYVCKYPKMTTEYTLCCIKDISLSSSTSQILARLG